MTNAATSASRSRITAIGTYVPERKLTNDDLAKMVDTSDEWIVPRTGIRERRISEDEEYTSHLCIKAVQNLLDRYNTTVGDVDLLLVCTSTPDFTFPGTACLVQAHFGITQTTSMDLSAACAGFVYGLHLADGMVSSGLHRKVLIIGAETLSKITDYTDRTTCILFGDGAGAVLVERDDSAAQQPSFLAYTGGTDGSGGVHLYKTFTASSLNGIRLHDSEKLVQNGREVYKFAVQTVPKGVAELTEMAGIEASDVDWFIPHSANLRIIESVCEKTGIPLERTLHTIERYGNTSAATIPLALDQGIREGRIKEGDTVLLFGFGSGFVYGGLLLNWRTLA
ncbi:ketoacyl-ACP synthase III [Paenibacillus allorhizosphaerae]|uniref:Beta-ketoacyl-[acyl-carrier-protein] synthase III n=1 Tax=Paenibacillus allorhizosphaerae TaxID=2849866 RepID=A0ABM8VL12_9BACL|nr:ketoacyl-ACP synthase III [Paenibacillus allorhizosphaerae]CAG7647801.1 3-oxoacyl-[acyl-carrier-protein] synthase 3 protein 2 [Paenibacillus allorhizosphaerae]